MELNSRNNDIKNHGLSKNLFVPNDPALKNK